MRTEITTADLYRYDSFINSDWCESVTCNQGQMENWKENGWSSQYRDEKCKL